MATGIFCDITRSLALPDGLRFRGKNNRYPWDEMILRGENAAGPQNFNSAQKFVQGSLSG
jgi:hypothetical protein